mmetsp:Transcript_11450/g.33976  ORF Transcript_11450/g.33976 Transcript_11450/m.33976 type:complete len:202 (+) Transcript_11450:605-1210(+)
MVWYTASYLAMRMRRSSRAASSSMCAKSGEPATLQRMFSSSTAWLVQRVSMKTMPRSMPLARHVLRMSCRRSSVEFVASKMPISPSRRSQPSMSSRASPATCSRCALASAFSGSKKSLLPDSSTCTASRRYLPTLNTRVTWPFHERNDSSRREMKDLPRAGKPTMTKTICWRFFVSWWRLDISFLNPRPTDRGRESVALPE